jgi:hypothetical protein
MANGNTKPARIENDVEIMKKPEGIKAEIIALYKEHGDDWQTHFDFLHPTPTKEEIIARNRTVREMQAEAAAGRASAGDSDKGEDTSTGQIYRSLIRLADCFEGEDLSFLRLWAMQNNCFGADRFVSMKKDEEQSLRDEIYDLERELKRETRQGDQVDPYAKDDLGDKEDQQATVQMELEQGRQWLQAATRAYRKVVGRPWKATPRKAVNGRTPTSRGDRDRDDRDDRRDSDRDERSERRRDDRRR